MIAFQRTVNGNTNIYVLDAASPESISNPAVQVTHGGADTDPAWAPFPVDSASSKTYPPIAFERRVNGHRDIFVSNYDGTNSANLTNSSGVDYAHPNWSSGGAGDSARLTFDSNQDGSRQVWIMDVGVDANHSFVNLGVREVTAGQAVSSNPSWFTFTPVVPGAQPVGPLIDRIAFAGPDQDGGNSQINIAEYDRATPNSTGPFSLSGSTSFSALTSDACENTAPAWSPTGAFIAYQKTAADGKSDIYVLDPTANDDAGDVSLTEHVGDNKNPDWEAVQQLDVEVFPKLPLGRRSRHRTPRHTQRQGQRAPLLTAAASGDGCQSSSGGSGSGLGGGTGSGKNGPGSGSGKSGPAFSARVLGIVVRGRSHSRVILISLKLNAPANVRAALRQGNRRVASRTWQVTAGSHILRLAVPARAPAGIYQVRLAARPASGPAASLSRRVRVGR
jgi:hypothetical protein